MLNATGFEIIAKGPAASVDNDLPDPLAGQPGSQPNRFT